MMALVEAGKVSTVIVKGMSRLGRNYLEVGQLTETVFPMHNVHFIASTMGWTAKGERTISHHSAIL